jgi:glycosyltransferase involved in cell wall biosynthesis
MKILLLAPHPFYQERGTPIAVDLLARALSERGDRVDILTFHEGLPRNYEHVRIYRIRPFIKVRNIGPGFSFKKLYCDIHLFFRFAIHIRQKQYDLVHAVEESAFMAMMVCRLAGMPFIYDMDSSITTQLVNKMKFLRPVTGFLHWMESLPVRSAIVVVPVCEALANDALQMGARRITVLKDIALTGLNGDKKKNSQALSLREKLGADRKIAMYIGNLESYQGVDLMLESFALVQEHIQGADLVVIGGRERDMRKYLAFADKLGIGDSVHFLGPKPVEDLGLYMSQADILISPRIEGQNTPMKVYSYLASGVPVLATDLPTHTQVVDSSIAMLAPPEKHAFAAAMIQLIEDEALCVRLAREAGRYIEHEHSYQSFRSVLHNLYDGLEAQVSTTKDSAGI